MHKVADVEIAKNIMAANDKLAHKNLHLLEDHDIFCVDFVVREQILIRALNQPVADLTVPLSGHQIDVLGRRVSPASLVCFGRLNHICSFDNHLDGR